MKGILNRMTNLVAHPQRRSLKNSRKGKPEHSAILDTYNRWILKSGYKSLKTNSLLSDFGYKKRSPQNVRMINQVLKENNLFCYPPLSMKTPWKANLRIYNFPVVRKGELFDSELKLQKYMSLKHTFNSIGVPTVKREESPGGTNDRFDFYGKFENTHVVIEVKNADGGKKAVEQLLRYGGYLKHRFPEEPVRKILVTGVSDFWTAYAIHGMRQEGRDEIEWYLYNYNSENDSICLEPVNYESYSRYFSAHNQTRTGKKQ